MKAVSNIEFRENEIKFLLNQIEKINKLIHLYKSHDEGFSVSEYTRHRQDFIYVIHNRAVLGKWIFRIDFINS